MRVTLWKFLTHRIARYLVVFGVPMTMVTLGCAQNDGGGQPPGGQTMLTEAGVTAQETTASGGRTIVQRTQDSDRGDTTTQEQGRTQQREGAREKRPSDQPGERQTITVRITGNEGLSFAGRVGTAQDRRRVQGNVPEEYEIAFEGAAVTAAVRKREPGAGTLGVEVVRDGEVVTSRETSTSTGVVNVVWSSQRQN